MVDSTTQYIGGGLPTNVVWAQGTTLFEIAANHLGNAMYWGAIAAINGLTDPWIDNLTQLKIPIIFDRTDTSGILEPTNSSMIPSPVVLAVPQSSAAEVFTFYTVFSKSLPSSSTGWGGSGFNSRQVLSASLLAFPALGGPIGIRVTIQFAATTAGNLDSAWVGTGATIGNAYNFSGDQVQLTFNGLTSITGMNGMQTLVSDTATFRTFNAAKPLVVAMHLSGTTVTGSANFSVTGATNWFLSGTDISGQTSPSGGWGSSSSQDVFVSLVEVETSFP